MTDVFTTWADLSATTGTAANEGAWVYGPDSGTHTDPVVGGTVANVGVYSWSVSPAGWQRIADLLATAQEFVALRQALNGSGNGSQILFDSATPPGEINSIGNDDAVSLRLVATTAKLTQGPTSQPVYYDNVFGLGWNISNVFTKVNPNIPASSYRIETKFAQGGSTDIFGSEYHIPAHIPIDTTNECRPHDIWVPHLESNYDSPAFAQTFRATTFTFSSGLNYEFMQWNLYGGAYSINFIGGVNGNNVALVWDKNNKAFAFQKNAAGTTINALPYYDSVDRHYTPAAIKFQGPSVLEPGQGTNFLMIGVNTAPIPGSAHDLLYSGVAVTGDYRGSVRTGKATGSFQNEVYNQTAAGRAGWDAQMPNGTAYYAMSDLTNHRYASLKLLNTGDVVLDNSQKGGTATKTGFTVKQATFQVQFAYPPVFPTFTVATLPAAATAGAGARAFASDANATTFNSVVAGGGANFVPVFSDGASWKIG